MSLRVASQSRGVGLGSGREDPSVPTTAPCERWGAGGFLSWETRAQPGHCLQGSGTGEEGQRRLFGNTITASQTGLFNTLSTGSPWQPGARAGSTSPPASLVLKAHLPPLPAGLLDPREARGPVLWLCPQQRTGTPVQPAAALPPCSRDPAPHPPSQEHHDKALAYLPLDLMDVDDLSPSLP